MCAKSVQPRATLLCRGKEEQRSCGQPEVVAAPMLKTMATLAMAMTLDVLVRLKS